MGKKIKFAIDASRGRSGGAEAHLIGIVSCFLKNNCGSSLIYVWAPASLLKKLPNSPMVIKKTSIWLELPLFFQMFWQAFLFKKAFLKFECDILLNTDGACLSSIAPCVTMSRDMLSYEKGELQRYPLGLARLRLLILKYVQNAAFRHASEVIFLTDYASSVIQQSCGKLMKTNIIPHGIDNSFRNPNREVPKFRKDTLIRFLYVSNVDYYKHQWNVVRALGLVREKGWNCSLTLAGGGKGLPQKRLEEQIMISDPENEFIKLLPFVTHKKIPMLLRNSDIFIFASSCENMPNSLIEAMAANMPIACSDRGPMPEVLKNGGLFFNPESYLSIYEAIINLLENQALCEELASNSYRLSQKYSWERCSRETFDCLRKVYDDFNK